MTQVTRKELLPGVHLTAVRTNKFKTSMLGLQLLTPIAKESAALNALLPSVLRRGTQNHPDMESLSAALDELYGGTVEPMVRKKGEAQCVGFVGSFLDDAYTPDGSRVLESAAALMGDLLLRPAEGKGGFRTDYVEGERANLVDRIRAQVNDKRQYSMTRLTQEMCAGEPYGIDKLGDEASAAAITVEGLWKQYHELLRTAQIELYYCGSAQGERVEKALVEALRDLRAGERAGQGTSAPVLHAQRGSPRLVIDAMDVTQGKLTLGFRTGGATVRTGDFPALLVLNAIYGGTPTSK
ncbi:MAG: insulinase family protein, partial [Clostridia bacterium]|nr:insulinase family protein [Clostridia bacterium]